MTLKEHKAAVFTRNKKILLFFLISVLGILGILSYFTLRTNKDILDTKLGEGVNLPQKRLSSDVGVTRPEYPISEELKNISEQVGKLFNQSYVYNKYYKFAEVASLSIEDKSKQQNLINRTLSLMDQNDFKYSGKSDIGFMGGKYSDDCRRNTTCTYVYIGNGISCEITTNFDYRSFLIVKCTQG